MRRGKSANILTWLGIWSGTYGLRLLILSPALVSNFPHSYQPIIDFLDVSISYLTLVFALLAWLDLTRGYMHKYLQAVIYIGLAIGLSGIVWYLMSGEKWTLMLYNNLIAAFTIFALLIIIVIRKFSNKYFVLPNRGVLAIGTFLFASEALYSNLSRLFGYQTWPIFGWLGFAALLFSLAYVAAKITFEGERRLIAIDNELETARYI